MKGLYYNVVKAPRALFNPNAFKYTFFTILYVIASTCHAQEAKKIIAFGDSLTAGAGLVQGEGFTDQLEDTLNQYGLKVDVLNAGVSGDTSSGGLARLEWVLDSVDNIDLVILELGANDALRGLPPRITRQNIDKMVSILKERKIPTLLAGMIAPPNFGEQFTSEYNPIFPDVAKKYDVLLYPFFLDGVIGDRELNQSDLMHPNPRGVKIIVDKIAPYVLEALVRVQKP
ncbi:MAG: arylesterase [Emcibacteraceae bacterium]